MAKPIVTAKDVTIIVPHFGQHPNSEFSLDQCIPSLHATVDSQVIIAKNGPPCSHFPNGKTPQGQCRAVNSAVKETDTPWIFVTNDDMVYAPGWFEKLTQFTNPEVACISPKLVEPRPGAPTFLVEFCGGAGGDFDKQKWLDYAAEYFKTGKGDLRRGFNLPFLMKREVWDTIEGYDENYDPWGSNGDSDLEYKLKLAGAKMFQSQDSIVYHFSQTSGTFHPDNRAFWDKNWHYFIDKWGFERASAPEIWTAAIEIPDDKLKYRPAWKGKYAD